MAFSTTGSRRKRAQTYTRRSTPPRARCTLRATRDSAPPPRGKASGAASVSCASRGAGCSLLPAHTAELPVHTLGSVMLLCASCPGDAVPEHVCLPCGAPPTPRALHTAAAARPGAKSISSRARSNIPHSRSLHHLTTRPRRQITHNGSRQQVSGMSEEARGAERKRWPDRVARRQARATRPACCIAKRSSISLPDAHKTTTGSPAALCAPRGE